jgi:integrase
MRTLARSVVPWKRRRGRAIDNLIRVHLKPILGHIPLARLSPHTIQECYTLLGRKLVRGKSISLSTVHYAAAILHKALADAMRRGLISRNPADQTDPPSCATEPTVVLTPAQLHTYLEDARQTVPIRLWALYVTKAGTGMRLGELLGLPESELDLDS